MHLPYSQQINQTIISCNTKEANPIRNITWLFQNSSNSTWQPITFIQASVSQVPSYHTVLNDCNGFVDDRTDKSNTLKYNHLTSRHSL